MPAPKISDQEFIRLRREVMSDTQVARMIGVDRNNVATRRKRLSKRYGVQFLTKDNRPAYDTSMLVTADRVEVKLKLKTGVILVSGDQHFHPGNVPTMHRALCYLAKQIKPFAIVWNGDAFDGASISRFAPHGWESRPDVKTELECVQDRSNEVMKASPNSKRIWVAGNHDMRFEARLASVAPEYRGVEGIHLKDHVPEWTPAWFVTVNEGTPSHTEIRHREKGGVHAAYNNTKEGGITIVTGHDHRADVVPYVDRRGMRYGVRHGMGADSSRDAPFVNYLEGRTTNWQSGIAVLTYKDGTLLMPELALRVDDGVFQFRGELIKV